MPAAKHSGSGVRSLKPKARRRDAAATLPAPTGRNMPAQGNALGNTPHNTSSPEGATQGEKLPNGWRWVTLRELATIAGGVTKGQKRRPHERVRKVPYLRVANVQRGYLDLGEVKEIEANESEITALRLQPGDILFNEGGDRDKLGRGWVWSGDLPECAHQNHVFPARLLDSTNNPKLISYYGNSAGQKYFWDQGKHTTNLASINLTKLGALPIPLPPPDVQRQIVAEIEKQFTRLDAGVAALRRVQANLKRYRAAVLKAACEGRLVPTESELAKAEGRSFETGHALLQRILADRRKHWQGKGKYKEPAEPDTAHLPPLPEGWAWASVDQLLAAPLCNGVSVKGTDGPPGVPALRLSAMSDNGFKYEEVRYLPLPASAVDDLWIQEGDFFISRGNGSLHLVGRGTLAQQPPGRLIFPDTMIRLCLSDPLKSSGWVAALWPSRLLRSQIEARVKTTAGIYKIAQPQVESIALPLPPLAEQTRIVAEVERRLSVVGELESVASANLQRAARLRQSILQKAFTGALNAEE